MQQAATYYGIDGNKLPGGGQEGGGFKKGDTVETFVDLDQGKIEWRVNGAYQATMVSKYLQKVSGSVVPYLGMYHAGDMV